MRRRGRARDKNVDMLVPMSVGCRLALEALDSPVNDVTNPRKRLGDKSQTTPKNSLSQDVA
jgi:hypothetical protein